MTDAGFVFAGYAACGLVLAAYAARLLVRSRALARDLPPEERRWQ